MIPPRKVKRRAPNRAPNTLLLTFPSLVHLFHERIMRRVVYPAVSILDEKTPGIKLSGNRTQRLCDGPTFAALAPEFHKLLTGIAISYGLGSIIEIGTMTAHPVLGELVHQSFHNDQGQISKDCVTFLINLTPVTDINGYTEFKNSSVSNKNTPVGSALIMQGYLMSHRGRANGSNEDRKLFLVTFNRYP